MGLFNRNSKETNFAGGSKNVMESIQRDHDTNTLIYLDPREDFNTESIITVAPNRLFLLKMANCSEHCRPVVMK